MLRGSVVTLLVLLGFAAPAAAVPGDAVPEPVAPADGSTLAAGQPVTLEFTCPPYRQSPAETEPVDRFDGYGVQVSVDPQFGRDVGTATIARSATPGQCTATPVQLGGGGPLTAPGTYSWRVTRSCFCGEEGAEYGRAATFTIPAARTTMAIPPLGRVYAGYGVLTSLRSDLPDGTPVLPELRSPGARLIVRERGRRPLPTSDGRVAVPLEFEQGRQEVRWVVVSGPFEGRTSPWRSVTSRPARGWRTGRRDVGRYRQSGPLRTTFTVAKAGRELRDFRAQVLTFCIGGLDPASNRTVLSLAALRRVEVAPDGRFAVVATVSKTDVQVSGRLRNGRVTDGRVAVSYPLCSGARSFTARRR